MSKKEQMRNFRYRIEWLINEDWEPREITISVPAKDCATDEQRAEMDTYLAGGAALFYGIQANDLEGFSADLVEEFLSGDPGEGDDT